MPKKFTQENFINRANIVHNFLYDYSKVNYINYETKVIIICKIHGEFTVSPHHHIGSKTTCQKCGRIRAGNTHLYTLEQFLNKAKEIHKNKYSYSNVAYKNTETNVSITCNIHGEFLQSPHSHSSGQGCPKCTRGGAWRKSEWVNVCNKKPCNPLVYIIRCFNETEEFVKIGRTKNTIKFRFRHKSIIPYSYEIIKEIKGSPDFVFDKEIELHRLYKEYKYKPLLSFAGETECFNISILQDLK
jgi:hypothetical protein